MAYCWVYRFTKFIIETYSKQSLDLRQHDHTLYTKIYPWNSDTHTHTRGQISHVLLLRLPAARFRSQRTKNMIEIRTKAPLLHYHSHGKEIGQRLLQSKHPCLGTNTYLEPLQRVAVEKMWSSDLLPISK